MRVKDIIVSWYLKNVLLPKLEIINHPGYIVAKFSEIKLDVDIREIFLSESLFSILESYSENLLYYKIGKKFGYVNALISNFPNIKTVKNKNKFLNFAYNLVRYVEGTWASKLYHVIDYSQKIFKLRMQNYIICSKNGLGYIFSTGGIAGIWAYACQDPTIEAVQPKCQGRGDKECEVIAAPYETLVKMGYKPIRYTKLEKAELTPEYAKLNQIRPTKWARNSLKSLMDSGVFDYRHGQVTYKGERFFLCEASFMYILEKELKKVKNGLKVLWDCSFDFGKRLAKISGKQDPCRFVMDFLPALGFGDVLAVKKGKNYEVYFRLFPWTKWADEIDFMMLRGLLSGIFSGFEDRNIRFALKEKGISEGSFTLLLLSE